jgi:hypothetical protein
MNDNKKLIEEARAFANAERIQGRTITAARYARLADALEAAEKAQTPTDDDRSSEQQVEQRHGDRGTDHEEQQTDDRAATGRLGVGGSHASSMPQATSDGKRVISHTPTDDDRESLLTEADALVASWDRKGSWSSDSPVGMVMRLAAALRRSVVPEPSARPLTPCGNLVCTGCRVCGCPALGIAPAAPVPQGEPSDAQIGAAAHVIAEAHGWNTAGIHDQETARAALRAASAVTAEPSREALLAQGFTEGVNFIDDQSGPWGAGMVAGRAEAARRRAAVTEQGASALPDDCDCEDREALVRPEGLVCGTCEKLIAPAVTEQGENR